MLQERWTNTYGPDATGQYAGKSYWLCTENWPNQNYPKDLSVYYESGGFSNGLVPLFIIVGFQNKVYYDSNYTSWESALQQAIDDMPTEGVFVMSPVVDITCLFSDNNIIDVSSVFKDLNDNQVTVTVESNSDPSLVTVSIDNNILTIVASSTNDGTATVTLKGTAGEFSATDDFTITVYDPANYFIEDFETGNFENIPWMFSAHSGWSIDPVVFYEGSFSAKSNDINDDQQAEMFVTVDYPTQGKVSFQAKASSELNYDFLRFFIDRYEMKKISGLTDWLNVIFPVQAGTHIFRWSYQKDGSNSYNNDCTWVDYITFEGGKVTGIENTIIPQEITLDQNYPNPFNPSTLISFNIPNSSEVKLSVFNHKGELVKSIFEGKLGRGNHSYNFNGSDLTSGLYFYKLQTEHSSIIKKMIMLK